MTCMLKNSVSLGDFCPWNQWIPTQPGSKVDDEWFDYDGRFEKDATTGRIYLEQDASVLRTKNIGLLVWTVAAHAIHAVSRFFNILTLHSFSEKSVLPLKQRAITSGKDILKLAITPFFVFWLEAAAFYGLLNPKDGRKQYATAERFGYQNLGIEGLDLFGRSEDWPICAPCYQPGFGR